MKKKRKYKTYETKYTKKYGMTLEAMAELMDWSIRSVWNVLNLPDYEEDQELLLKAIKKHVK